MSENWKIFPTLWEGYASVLVLKVSMLLLGPPQEIVGVLPGTSLLEGIALDWKHNRAYATDEKEGFYVIDLTSGAILGQVSNLHYPNEVVAIPGTSLAVEPDTGSNRAVFIDASTFTVKNRVTVGKFPTGVAVNARTKRVYVANRHSNTVSVIQLPRDWWTANQ